MALALTPAGAPAADPCTDGDAQATRDNLPEIAASVVCLVNRERAAHGRGSLRSSIKLKRAARAHSVDMVRRRYFSHVSPDGTDLVVRARRTGYVSRRAAWSLAENLGWGSGHLGTAAEMVKAWMDSPGHRENIMRPEMEHIGVGLSFGTPHGGRGLTGTLLFGRRG